MRTSHFQNGQIPLLRSRRSRALAAIFGLALAGCLTSGSGGEEVLDDERLESNRPRPGSTVSDSTLDLKVYSSRATRIEVFVYRQPKGEAHVMRQAMTRDPATNLWSVSLSRTELAKLGIDDAVYYGYRAWGPNWTYVPAWKPGSQAGFIKDVDSEGNRFNPNKLLIDPYAKEISHDPTYPGNVDGTVYASGSMRRTFDTGPVAPKSIAFTLPQGPIGTKPTRPFKDDIVYEVHVRGLTMNDPSIPAEYRGTYKGAGMKAAALAELGITAVELLPVHEGHNDQNDATVDSTSGDNYWGYMTVNYFAPDRRYAADKSPGGPTSEFQGMVKAFHDEGIKVFVDVVYNHTSEGGMYRLGAEDVQEIYSYRGLDNPTYYSLTQDRQSSYDNTGVGGNFNTYNPIAQDLIVDSLKHWRDVLGVDGYRFDLASVLGNTCEHGCFNYDKLNPGTALNRIWRDLSPRPAGGGAGVDLVAEPWAIGGNSYQVGNFPSGWIEWNGIYRDTLRKDQNQLGIETVTPGQLAMRFSGSADLFSDDGRQPWSSVNFMTAHDGMTLNDLYSCNQKNNSQPWPYGPSDGGEDNNHSWDHGGSPTAQRLAARTGMAFMMFSAGVPMFNGGDEFLRTQYCNNNAYNLDSDKNWLDYALTTDQQSFRAFTRALIAFRKAHPALRPGGFYSDQDTNGNVMEQLRWFKPDGNQADAIYFNNANNHAIAWRIDGTEFNDPAPAIYVAYNGWSGNVDFTLPWPGTGKRWYRVTDTCPWIESRGANQVHPPGSEELVGDEGATYGLCGRGFIAMIAR